MGEVSLLLSPSLPPPPFLPRLPNTFADTADLVPSQEKKKAAKEEKKVEAEGKKEDAAEKKAEGGAEGEKKEDKKKGDEGKKEGAGGVGDGKTAAEGGGGEAGGEKKETPPPPPPEEIVLRVYMHCEGCARKVQRSLAGFPGVEEVKADSRTQMVVVKGKSAAADPLRVVERLQRKSGRKVELLSPIPPKPEEEEEKKEVEAEKPKPEEGKKEEPSVIEVVLKVRMHCDACSQEIKKRILKMKGKQKW
ncbi:hypothetical protein Taro_005544 [Colocasia esculenta]|uniref:HMA domain-containing protein n=1 Tax=Colocasia esculenta TaxID=4460 RepID=A0A843TY36_COLES|nr:hypothetical protein [Colocasia esculenta]